MEVIDNPTSPQEEEREARFRQRIGFDDLSPSWERALVVARWEDPAKLPDFAGGAWRTASDTIWSESGGVAREWVLARDGEILAVRVFVSGSGSTPAREFLLAEALASNAEEVPFQLLEREGSFMTLVAEGAAWGELRNDHALVIFHNVVLHLAAHGAAVDVVAAAHELRKTVLAQARESMEEDYPVFPSPRPSERARVGEQIAVLLPGAPDPEGFGQGGYEVEVDIGGEGVELVGFREDSAILLPRSPGPAVVRVQAIDRETLLSSELTLNLEVEAPDG